LADHPIEAFEMRQKKLSRTGKSYTRLGQNAKHLSLCSAESEAISFAENSSALEAGNSETLRSRDKNRNERLDNGFSSQNQVDSV